MILGSGKRSALVTLAVLACIPGVFFSLLWVAAHISPDLVGSLLQVDPKHPHPDSSLVGIIFVLFALDYSFGTPVCLIAVVLGVISIFRKDVSAITKLFLGSLIALSIAGSAWVAGGMR